MTRSSRTPAEIVLKEVHNWLELGDDLLPIVILASVVANRIGGKEPVWTMIVGPPSSGKSELIRAIAEIHGIHQLGKLTGRTLVSGMPGGDRSLLTWMKKTNKWLMTHKDWGTVMSAPPTERNEILGQLREIYDGEFNAQFGTGVKVNWKGKLGFIVGATRAVDRLQKWSTELGERFIQFRPTAPDKNRVTIRAALNEGRGEEMQRALRSAYIRAFVHAMNISKSTEPSPDGNLIAGALGNLVALARTPVFRDRYNGGQQVSEPEGPARLTGQFTQLYRATSVCFGGDREAATDLIVRVGIDSITPGIRRKLITRLAGSKWGLSVDGLGRSLGCDDNTARTHLEDLVALGLATQTKPAKKTIYAASDLLGDLVSQVYLDEFTPEEALQKLSQLHANYIHEGKEKEEEKEDRPTSPQLVGR